MSNVVLLDNVEHHDLKVKMNRGEAYGDHVNQALVFPNEFRDLQREYPILFRKDDEGNFCAVALLGLDRDENLFLRGDQWDGNYIPAVLARGPFSIVLQKNPDEPSADPEAKIQIDLDSPAVSKEEGLPIFLPQGGNAPILEHAVNVLRALHDGVAISKGYFAMLEELELIEPIALEIKTSETKQYSFAGVYSISQEKFQALPAEALNRLHKNGILASCYWVMASLDNIRSLVDRKNRA
ncbi:MULTISPECIES: SapC family protein [Kordiimonas]|jgi:hypothetical protein|uniref:SapC family protein n=1 Tax=Kordiimonas TaxID=288021 RepID=UPI0025797288|nr:SapC family protein [Kordiimonas sp. UBA4487]